MMGAKATSQPEGRPRPEVRPGEEARGRTQRRGPPLRRPIRSSRDPTAPDVSAPGPIGRGSLAAIVILNEYDRQHVHSRPVGSIRFRPKCMDRLPFASEGVLSEVADMYPAC